MYIEVCREEIKATNSFSMLNAGAAWVQKPGAPVDNAGRKTVNARPVPSSKYSQPHPRPVQFVIPRAPLLSNWALWAWLPCRRGRCRSRPVWGASWSAFAAGPTARRDALACSVACGVRSSAVDALCQWPQREDIFATFALEHISRSSSWEYMPTNHGGFLHPSKQQPG
jgi:hypothetical protein